MADFFSRNQAQVDYAQLKAYLQNNDDVAQEDSVRLRSLARRHVLIDDKIFYKDSEGEWEIPSADSVDEWILDLHRNFGHMKSRALFSTLRTRWRWASMQKDIEDIIAKCQECQHGYVANRKDQEGQQPIVGSRHNWKLFDEWGIDLITGLPKTKRGMTAALIALESVSGFPEAFALKNKTAEEVAGCLLHLFCRYAAPRRLRSDGGKEFLGGVKAVCEELGIQQVVTSAYHPQANGQTERQNGDVMRHLEAHLREDEDWDLSLDNVLLGLRIQPSRRHGLSSFEVLFGESPRLPMKIKFRGETGGLPINLERLNHVGIERFISNRSDEHKVRWERIRARIKAYQDSQRPSGYKKGDMVMVRNFERKKGDSRWIGPFVVLGDTFKGIEIKSEHGNSRFLTLADVKRWKSPVQQMEPQLGGVSVEVRATETPLVADPVAGEGTPHVEEHMG
jgi:transposase InsO family protein